MKKEPLFVWIDLATKLNNKGGSFNDGLVFYKLTEVMEICYVTILRNTILWHSITLAMIYFNLKENHGLKLIYYLDATQGTT